MGQLVELSSCLGGASSLAFTCVLSPKESPHPSILKAIATKAIPTKWRCDQLCGQLKGRDNPPMPVSTQLVLGAPQAQLQLHRDANELQRQAFRDLHQALQNSGSAGVIELPYHASRDSAESRKVLVVVQGDEQTLLVHHVPEKLIVAGAWGQPSKMIDCSPVLMLDLDGTVVCNWTHEELRALVTSAVQGPARDQLQALLNVVDEYDRHYPTNPMYQGRALEVSYLGQQYRAETVSIRLPDLSLHAVKALQITQPNGVQVVILKLKEQHSKQHEMRVISFRRDLPRFLQELEENGIMVEVATHAPPVYTAVVVWKVFVDKEGRLHPALRGVTCVPQQQLKTMQYILGLHPQDMLCPVQRTRILMLDDNRDAWDKAESDHDKGGRLKVVKQYKSKDDPDVKEAIQGYKLVDATSKHFQGMKDHIKAVLDKYQRNKQLHAPAAPVLKRYVPPKPPAPVSHKPSGAQQPASTSGHKPSGAQQPASTSGHKPSGAQQPAGTSIKRTADATAEQAHNPKKPLLESAKGQAHVSNSKVPAPAQQQQQQQQQQASTQAAKSNTSIQLVDGPIDLTGDDD